MNLIFLGCLGISGKQRVVLIERKRYAKARARQAQHSLEVTFISGAKLFELERDISVNEEVYVCEASLSSPTDTV